MKSYEQENSIGDLISIPLESKVITSGIRTITIQNMRLVISLLLSTWIHAHPIQQHTVLKVRIQNWIYFFASLLLLHYILYEWPCFNQRQLKYLYNYLPPVFITVTPAFFNCFNLLRQFLGHDSNLCQIHCSCNRSIYYFWAFDISIDLHHIRVTTV